MHRYFSSYEEQCAHKQGEKDAYNGRHEDYSRSRYDGPTDRAYFQGYDDEKKEERRRLEERQEEERRENEYEKHRAEERAREQEYIEQQYYAEQLEREQKVANEPEQDKREAGTRDGREG